MTAIFFKGSQVFIDLLVLTLAFLLAFFFRFGYEINEHYFKLFFFTLPYVVLLQYVVLSLFGVPNFAWRYVNLRDAQWIAMALGTATAILIAIRLATTPFGGYSRFVTIPYAILLGNTILATAGIISVRAVRRIIGERSDRHKQQVEGPPPTPTLLIGAGQAGVIVAREIAARPDLRIKPVGFVDDDPIKQGTRIQGLRVHGKVDDIASIAKRFRAKHALITIANASGEPIRRISRICQEAGLNTKIIPCVYELVSENVNLTRIRDVAIEDLLGRSPIDLDESALYNAFKDQRVLISGAGGSIGSELCRQVMVFKPSRIILVEKSENALFEIHRELKNTFPETDIRPVLADVRDQDRLRPVFEEHRPHAVIHAAAHKHVPMVEWNSGEAVFNNVGGTQVIADLADEYAVSSFVLISTDKAVNPTSVMGATKRVAELYVQSMSERSNTRFVAVRFGNVLGSAGSVIPIFKEQIAKGGPVTVTDPNMTRYFMTIPEASQLVLQAASMGDGGEIFILDMGEPIKIVDLAKDLIGLSGLRPDVDIEISYSGIRPGEKLFEELSIDSENTTTTKHSKIFIGRIAPQQWSTVSKLIAELKRRALAGSRDEIKNALKTLVPEFSFKESVALTSEQDDSAAKASDPNAIPQVPPPSSASSSTRLQSSP